MLGSVWLAYCSICFSGLLILNTLLLLQVDPEETDMWGGFRKIGEKLLNFGGQKAPDKVQKPIMWASSYGKTVDAQKKKKQAEWTARRARSSACS